MREDTACETERSMTQIIPNPRPIADVLDPSTDSARCLDTSASSVYSDWLR